MLLAIDGNNLISRYWHAAGENAVDVAISTCEAFVQKYHTIERKVIAFDYPPYWRRDLNPEYKQDRKPKDPQWIDALDEGRRRFEQYGYELAQVKGFEADDIIATLATTHPGKVIMFSTDRDLWQCLEADRVIALLDFRYPKEIDHFGDNERVENWYSYENLGQDYAMTPDQFLELQMMIGKKGQWDGAKGIGEKIGGELLRAYGSLEKLFAGNGQVRVSEKKREALEEFRGRVDTVRQLATLRSAW